MAKYRILYAIALACALAFAFGYSGHLSLSVLITLAVFPLISFLFLLVTFFSISVSSSVREKSYRKNDDFKAIISVKNRSPFPVCNAVIRACLPSIDPKVKNCELVFSLTPLRTKKLPLTHSLRFRGLYSFECKEIELYDLTKMFRIRKKLNFSEEISVFPRHIRLDDTHAGIITENESPLSLVNDANGSEQNFVREYCESDSLKNIHWKLSAKHDNYLVRQMATGISTGTAVVCDFHAKSGNILFDAECADVVCEAAIALSYNAILNGEEALNIWYDETEKSEKCTLVSNEIDFSRLFYDYARTNIYKDGDSFEKVASVFAEQLCGRATVIFITPVVTQEFLTLLEGISAVVPRTAVVEVGGLTGEDVKGQLRLSSGIKFCELYGRDSAHELSGLISADWRKE